MKLVVLCVFFGPDVSKQTAMDCLSSCDANITFLGADESSRIITIGVPARDRSAVIGQLDDRPEIVAVQVVKN